ncbi:MAG TPA: pentapeptide repeat-containing protein, partial [Ktedonobacteraceae bacterium]|nr:pentapeptide repeat-containing protein [Ktedonobacteraceae bacterium]
MPGFTFGLDVILLVGQLRLGEHKTVDEIHHLLMERLAPLSQTISRREILFLFEAYTALLRAGTEVREDQHWREEVLRNGGLLLSLDGIQPDKGNETMYLVRDVLTGRILTAENVTSSTKVMIKQGSSAWNAWRVQHEEVRPDLGAADLGAADLSFANLSNADLSFANLNNAN